MAGLGRLLQQGYLQQERCLRDWIRLLSSLFLLVVWAVGLRQAWRRSLIAWGILGALVAPLLVGYSLRFREPLAPLNVEMGPDIQELVSPLFRMEYGFSEVISYFSVGNISDL